MGLRADREAREAAAEEQRRSAFADLTVLDMREELLKPRPAIRWRCQDFLADGTLTMLTGAGGKGKSALMLEMAGAVASGGGSVAGIRCLAGSALIFDSEMGSFMHMDRVETFDCGYDVGYVDMMGRDLSQPELLDRCIELIKGHIDPEVGGFVGFDSLRRLFPRAKENDSDDIAPAISALAAAAREVRAGLLIIHHEGWTTGRGRGSSAAVDQVDMAYSLQEEKGEETGRKLVCTKARICAEPPPRYLSFSVPGGFAKGAAPPPATLSHAAAILACLPQTSMTVAAQACGATRKAGPWRKAWDSLLSSKRIAQGEDGCWVATGAAAAEPLY